eukprot:9072167-Pyramimonas_sp.AAC.1
MGTAYQPRRLREPSGSVRNKYAPMPHGDASPHKMSGQADEPHSLRGKVRVMPLSSWLTSRA